jgi:putative component of membrane protein insertase Oxa1/YidC/SpoIIIJ protein YidD
MRVFILLLSFLLELSLFSQEDSKNVNEKLIQVSFDYSQAKPAKKINFFFKKRRSYLNPLNYLGIAALYIYQNTFSEQIQANCNYEVSCSEYTKLTIQASGFFIGTLKGFNQLSECTPNARYEHPLLYINNEGKIINRLEKEIK